MASSFVLQLDGTAALLHHEQSAAAVHLDSDEMLSQSAASVANEPGKQWLPSAHKPISSIFWSRCFVMHAFTQSSFTGVGHASTHLMPPSHVESFVHAATCGLQCSERHLVTLTAMGAGPTSSIGAAAARVRLTIASIVEDGAFRAIAARVERSARCDLGSRFCGLMTAAGLLATSVGSSGC